MAQKLKHMEQMKIVSKKGPLSQTRNNSWDYSALMMIKEYLNWVYCYWFKKETLF